MFPAERIDQAIRKHTGPGDTRQRRVVRFRSIAHAVVRVELAGGWQVEEYVLSGFGCCNGAEQSRRGGTGRLCGSRVAAAIAVLGV